MKKLTEDENRFIELYKYSYASLNNIAKAVGVTRGTIHRWRVNHFPDIPPEKRKMVLFERLYDSKLFTVDEIALFLQMTRMSVTRLMRSTKTKKSNLQPKIKNSKINKLTEQRQVNYLWGGISENELKKCAKQAFRKIRK